MYADRRSRSPESPERRYASRSRRDYNSSRRRSSRSWSRSRSRERSRERRRRHSRSRSRSHDRYRRGGSPDLYKDIIDADYQNDRHHRNERSWDRDRDRERYYYKERDRQYRSGHSPDLEDVSSNDSFDSDQVHTEHYRNQTPSKTIIILGLAQHISEADINNDLMHYGLQPVSIRLIRKRKTGASRGFAFVEFNTDEEAIRWMEYKQGVIMLNDQYRAVMQYSVKIPISTDWYCVKCGGFNFRRRDNCFKCYASREESVRGGEGSDEVSNILTKKIILRNLDTLTNEERVLTVMQDVVPTLVAKIAKVLICRDPLTSTSRGICYLSFDNLVDSMNIFNALKALDPPLTMEGREIFVSYCVDSENRQIAPKPKGNETVIGPHLPDSNQTNATYSTNTHQYTLADVPRLAEYSASLYASTSIEHGHYLKYYTDYYVAQITKGHFSNLPTINQLGETANSGAAVALSAIQRKQQKQQQYKTTVAVHSTHLSIPTGSDNKTYSAPDVSLYQYDETSGYYYDPLTGLYYDANSQYYYNNETGSYLYWNSEKSTYILATNETDRTVKMAANVSAPNGDTNVNADSIKADNNTDNNKDDEKNDQLGKKDGKHDKVKVAKKIVKDMEKWAKQLNQKKDINYLQPPVPTRDDDTFTKISRSGYADVGFSILENKERGKLSIDVTTTGEKLSSAVNTPSATLSSNKLVSSYGSDSENEHETINSSQHIEKDHVDFTKLTCLLCKRAFQSMDILNKHLKMSNLHKENLQKFNIANGEVSDKTIGNAQAYRDRAKERRLKYGESDPPPINKTRERFERELSRQNAAAQAQKSSSLASVPIGENNVGNRLLQKMGWKDGQGLGRSNQGRTNIIEAESRAPAAGLGSKSTAFAPGDDYKTYIKKMMKSRYESAGE